MDQKEKEWIWEDLGGGMEDKYDQNMLYEVRRDSVKNIF